MKEKKIVKIIIYFILTFSMLIVITLLFFSHVLFDEKDFCLDTSICKEGLEVNTEYGLIKINEENCVKYNWKWDDSSKMCNMKL